MFWFVAYALLRRLLKMVAGRDDRDDGELDAALASPVQQLVAGASRVNAQQQLDVLDVLGGNLLDRLLGHRDLIGGGTRAGREDAAHWVRANRTTWAGLPAMVQKEIGRALND